MNSIVLKIFLQANQYVGDEIGCLKFRFTKQYAITASIRRCIG